MTEKQPEIMKYLLAMNEHKASDMYLTVGFSPSLRIEGEIMPLRDEPLSSSEISGFLTSILTSRQKREFEKKLELNTSLDAGKYGRFRVNVLRQRQMPALVIRRIVSRIPDFRELRLPAILEDLSLEKRGLVLVTGMTGSGKSTTLASMIDYRNQKEKGHIITIENPIEYFHEHKKSVITQREVGVDTESFSSALKNSLRQRPDVILVGEIRDRLVMEQALTASETGHLCLSTLHTNNSYQSVERIVNMFPEEYHRQVRMSLSMNLKAIVSQRLVPTIEGGMTVAIEIMLNQGLVKELINNGKITKIRDVMEQNNQLGMCTFDQSLFRLFCANIIAEETAVSFADQPGDLKIRIKQHKMGDPSGKEALNKMDTSLLSFYD